MENKPQMNDAILDARVDALYRVVRGRIEWSNLIPTCLEIAQELEQMKELRGKERLEVLQRTLKFALTDSNLPEEKKSEILMYIDTIVPIAMQAAILASKVPIRQIQAGCMTCWKKCTS